jgi:uncharacterized protein YndB with AHSA1/START domain
MSTMEKTRTTQVYRVYIKATPQAIWDAITKPEWTDRYGYGGMVEGELRTGAPYRILAGAGMQAAGVSGPVIDGELLEVDPPRKLVQTWRMLMDTELKSGGLHPPHLRDPRRGGWRFEADRDPRARRCAEAGGDACRWTGRHRCRRRLELGAQRPQESARDRRFPAVAGRLRPGLTCHGRYGVFRSRRSKKYAAAARVAAATATTTSKCTAETPCWSGARPIHQKLETKRSGSSQPARSCNPATR